MYGADVSHTLISKVTDAVIDEVNAWQTRPLDKFIQYCTGVSHFSNLAGSHNDSNIV